MGHVGKTGIRRAVAMAAAGLLVAGCGGGSTAAEEPAAPSTASTVISKADLVPGDTVPAPTGTTVLTVSGSVAQLNEAGGLALDAAVLDRLGVTKVHVHEPWVKQDMDFQGVWLKDLLAVAEAAPGSTVVQATALDDYQVTLAMDDVREGGVFLATKDGQGRPLPVEDGGPTRIVFTEGVAAGRNADQWIWSVTTLDVR